MSLVFHPVFVYLLIAIGFVAFTMVITHLFPWGGVRKNKAKMGPFECGVDPVDDARRPFDVRYYRIAIAFLIFDVEVLLLFPGAVAFGKRLFTTGAATMGVVFVELLVFIALLAVAYVYAWRKGVFRWR